MTSDKGSTQRICNHKCPNCGNSHWWQYTVKVHSLPPFCWTTVDRIGETDAGSASDFDVCKTCGHPVNAQ
jgi:ribosomal protein L32